MAPRGDGHLVSVTIIAENFNFDKLELSALVMLVTHTCLTKGWMCDRKIT